MTQTTSAILLLTSTLLCVSCGGPLQGAHVDLNDIARPTPVADIAPTPPPQPPPGPRPSPGTFRAWVPRDATPNGDVIEGHYLVISLTPPAVEAIEPAKIMPRAPRPYVGAKQPGTGVSQIPVIPAPGGIPSGMIQPMDPAAAREQARQDWQKQRGLLQGGQLP
jgi:hypothetical protein